MKRLALSAICAGAMAWSASSEAAVISVLGNIDYPANQISLLTGQNGLGQQNVLDWLEAVVSQAGLPAPTTDISNYTGGPIEAGDYLVLHYGVGSTGNQGSGGGLVALYFDAAQASFSVPANGAGPNGTGGLSFARLFDHGTPPQQTPDSGTTLAFLGLGLTGISFLSRSLKARQ